jgi:hypothetical protein
VLAPARIRVATACAHVALSGLGLRLVCGLTVNVNIYITIMSDAKCRPIPSLCWLHCYLLTPSLAPSSLPPAGMCWHLHTLGTAALPLHIVVGVLPAQDKGSMLEEQEQH